MPLAIAQAGGKASNSPGSGAEGYLASCCFCPAADLSSPLPPAPARSYASACFACAPTGIRAAAAWRLPACFSACPCAVLLPSLHSPAPMLGPTEHAPIKVMQSMPLDTPQLLETHPLHCGLVPTLPLPLAQLVPADATPGFHCAAANSEDAELACDGLRLCVCSRPLIGLGRGLRMLKPITGWVGVLLPAETVLDTADRSGVGGGAAPLRERTRLRPAPRSARMGLMARADRRAPLLQGGGLLGGSPEGGGASCNTKEVHAVLRQVVDTALTYG